MALSIRKAWKMNSVGRQLHFLIAFAVLSLDMSVEHQDKTATLLIACSTKT